MPRTVLVFLNNELGLSAEARNHKAAQKARAALENYWVAMEGTLDPIKVQNAVSNALVGDPESIKQQIKQRFHPEDRLMLWFDFNDHDNHHVKQKMTWFMENVGDVF